MGRKRFLTVLLVICVACLHIAATTGEALADDGRGDRSGHEDGGGREGRGGGDREGNSGRDGDHGRDGGSDRDAGPGRDGDSGRDGGAGRDESPGRDDGAGHDGGSGRDGNDGYGEDAPDRGGRSEPGDRSEPGREGHDRSISPRAPEAREQSASRAIGSDAAMKARDRGEIVSLKDILDTTRSEEPGEVIEVKLFEKRDGAIYRVKTIDDNGIVHTTHVDAKTGRVIGILGILGRSFGLNEGTDR